MHSAVQRVDASRFLLTFPDFAFLPKKCRLSVCLGTQLEVQYSLQGFGISREFLPVDANGDFTRTRHLEYLHQLRQRENAKRASIHHPPSSSDDFGKKYANRKEDRPFGITTPDPNDVLLGKGKQYQGRAGNMYLSELVEKHKKEYVHAQSQIEKTCIIQLIVKLIQERRGRFLLRDNKKQYWVELPTEEAWTRVGRRFRK